MYIYCTVIIKNAMDYRGAELDIRVHVKICLEITCKLVHSNLSLYSYLALQYCYTIKT
jgi:hypothetical protein